MRTICCQAPRYSLDNVSKMPPSMNALDSYFGKWNGTNMWQIKSVSLDTDQRIFIKLVQQSIIIILFLLVVVVFVFVVANHRTRYSRTKIALKLQSSSHLGDTNTMIDTNVSGANCTVLQLYTELMGRCNIQIMLPVGRNRCVFLVCVNDSFCSLRLSESLSSSRCTDGMQIHHNVLVLVSSCSGSLNCGTGAKESD